MMDISVVDGALVRRAGTKSAPPLFLIHAFGDTGHCYEKVCSHDLAGRYALIVVDLWGFGASPARPDIRTVAEFSQALEKLIPKLDAGRPIGLVGHSIAAVMAVEIASRDAVNVSGVFSIEGNLTPDDAMFTGRASGFDDPQAFKTSFLQEIWRMGETSDALRHYYSGARLADAETMWHLGRDAKRISVGNRLGEAFQQLPQPKLYYWSEESTPAATQEWIARSEIPNRVYEGAGHWPMVDQPDATARQIGDFFDQIRA